ncbi:MAG: V-type ATP synthase subunit K [Actinomycetota bacterium]|nr:V-type ATP synthase subunit K [Actinomycetota bacterium]
MKEFVLGMTGVEWVLLGGALAAFGGGLGSAIGLSTIGNTAAGIIAEDGEKFGKVLPLAAMPSTQGIYGFITALLAIGFLGDLSLSATEGMRVFFACLPVALLCAVSGIYQGVVAVGAAGMVAKKDENAGKSLIFPALVETYAVLAFIVSIMMMNALR